MKTLVHNMIARRLVAWLLFGSLVPIAGCVESAIAPDRETLPLVATPSLGLGSGFSSWTTAVNVQSIPGTHVDFNTTSNDGCPFSAPDGLTFYMASNRTLTASDGSSGLGGLDIWVATRPSADAEWGEPVNVGAPVNSTADDFCPTMSRDGHTLYFVSRRSGGCGLGDVYAARRRSDGLGFEQPEMLPCDASDPYDAVNSPFDEFSPFPHQEAGVGPSLYFSSFRPGGFAGEAAGATPDSDIYRSASHGGVFGLAELIAGINTASDDGQPNVGNDGLELFFYSTRPGAAGADIYVSSRDVPNAPWSAPANLGSAVNSVSSETRPSLSWDGTTLYFGSNRTGTEGSGDIYVSTRRRLNASGGN